MNKQCPACGKSIESGQAVRRGDRKGSVTDRCDRGGHPQAPSPPLGVSPPAPRVTEPAPPPADLEQSRLIAMLRSPDRKSRQSAAEALQARGWVTLKQALDHESDAPTKARIAAAIQKVGTINASGRLVASLEDDDASIQLRAAVLLLQQRDDATAAADLKKTACEVLGRLADHDDVPHKPVEPLIVLLSDADRDIRHSAAYALEQLKWEPTSPEEGVLLDKAKP
jgi:HEAT repeat protein